MINFHGILLLIKLAYTHLIDYLMVSGHISKCGVKKSLPVNWLWKGIYRME